MTRRILSSILILVIFAFTGLAQTQQGLVKIKGRYSPSGQVIPGPPLAGVSVKVKGRNAVLSKKNGTFQFPVPSAKFYVERVALAGYQLTDPDLLSKQFSFSKDNPLEVIMERYEDHARDLENAKNSIRREMRKEIRKREDEIDRLREENKISEQKYRDLMQKCREDEEKSENLVQAMGERFASIDFDKNEGEDKRISILILNGELVKADSILRSKGNFKERLSKLKLVKQANAEIRTNLEASERLAAYDTENYAKEAYHLYQIHALRFQNDSAAYYLECRANLDTLNVNWQIDAGNFISDFICDFNKSLYFYKRGLTSAILHKEINPENIAKCYYYIGILYAKNRQFDNALEYLLYALEILEKQQNKESSDIAELFNSIGAILLDIKQYDVAMLCLFRSLDIQFQIIGNEGEETLNIASTYSNLGSYYAKHAELDVAIQYFEKALRIRKKFLSEDNLLIAQIYSNMSAVFLEKIELDKALDYQESSLNIRKKILGDKHLNVASTLKHLGRIYFYRDEYDKALENFEKVVLILKEILGDEHNELREIYNQMGAVYASKGYFDKASEYFEKGGENK